MVAQGTFPIFFLPKWGPRFWNTFAADQMVFQNRGFTVVTEYRSGHYMLGWPRYTFWPQERPWPFSNSAAHLVMSGEHENPLFSFTAGHISTMCSK